MARKAAAAPARSEPHAPPAAMSAPATQHRARSRAIRTVSSPKWRCPRAPPPQARAASVKTTGRPAPCPAPRSARRGQLRARRPRNHRDRHGDRLESNEAQPNRQRHAPVDAALRPFEAPRASCPEQRRSRQPAPTRNVDSSRTVISANGTKASAPKKARLSMPCPTTVAGTPRATFSTTGTGRPSFVFVICAFGV